MTFESTHALVEQVAMAVHDLRVTLENHELPGLEAAILNSQMALKSLENFPGGVEGLKQRIASYTESQQTQLNDRLAQARSDHQLNSELLRLAMQRNAALQLMPHSLLPAQLTLAKAGFRYLAVDSCLASFKARHFSQGVDD